MAEPQIIPARHGVATFVPAGQCIKIINTSGTQVVDTWAFALPQPAPKRDVDESTKAKEEAGKQETANAADKIKSKNNNGFPSQEEAEKATRDGYAQAEQQQQQDSQKKSGWSSYMPSIPTSLGLAKKSDGEQAKDKAGSSSETQQQKNSRTWASYFSPGKAFSSYIPEVATDTVSKFVNVHSRDTNKTYIQQLADFSKTPVGAAGMSAFTGSGYSGSLYAGYQAWNAKNAADAPSVEFMSMSHTRSCTLHLVPKQNDVLVTNLREPILKVIEDKSPGIHDTLIPACDPPRYRALGVDHWEEHGSCAENLVLALKELNERAGLKGAKAIGADVTINSVPAPLNLFMNIPWDDEGDISFDGPQGKAGDYIRLRAERDVVVVMSACPNDVNGINGEKISDANFIVEEEGVTSAIKRTQPKKNKKMAPKMTTASPNATPSPAQAGSSPSHTVAKKKTPVSPSIVSGKKESSQSSPIPGKAPPPTKPPPAKAAPAPAKTPNPTAQKATAARPTKKPAPAPVKPQTSLKSDSSVTPVERKKPRKLVRQPAQS